MELGSTFGDLDLAGRGIDQNIGLAGKHHIGGIARGRPD